VRKTNDMLKGRELSPAELRVYKMLLTTQSRREIAEALNLSEATIRFHCTNIYRKRGVHSRQTLIIQAYRDAQHELSLRKGSE